MIIKNDDGTEIVIPKEEFPVKFDYRNKTIILKYGEKGKLNFVKMNRDGTAIYMNTIED